MDDLPTITVTPQWQKEEEEINKDRRPGIVAKSPKEALKKMKGND